MMRVKNLPYHAFNAILMINKIFTKFLIREGNYDMTKRYLLLTHTLLMILFVNCATGDAVRLSFSFRAKPPEHFAIIIIPP